MVFIMSILLIALHLIVSIFTMLLQLRECTCPHTKSIVASNIIVLNADISIENQTNFIVNIIPVKEHAPNNSNHSREFQLKSRSDWLAAPSKNPLSDLSLPASRVTIAHTATANCSTAAVCSSRVRSFQTYHMNSRGWDDISYNFLIGGDNYVYEGRGWHKLGACAKGFNDDIICIAFIGTFTDIAPTDQQLEIAQQLLRFGVRLNKLKADYRLYGQRQVMTTESPGAQLYSIIKTWEHWQATTDQE